MFKAIHPKDFVAGRKYRVSNPEYREFIYTCAYANERAAKLLRVGGYAMHYADSSWLWEEIEEKPKKKKKFL